MKLLYLLFGIGLLPLIQAVSTFSSISPTPSAVLLPPPGRPPINLTCENSPANRSCWGDYDITTNYYTTVPDTGVTRIYYLTILNTTLSPDGVERIVQVVNGTYPGPTLYADWGDNVVIHVTNRLSTNGSSIHWHGIRQNYTNQNDGVVSLTQCPIAPNQTYTYQWRATQYGTSWYHSHIGLQAWEGVFGGIVINGPTTASWDVDLGVLFLNDWSHRTVDELYQYAQTVGPPTLDNGLINGTNTWMGGGSRFTTIFTPGTRYLIRLINAAVDSHFKFSIDNHTMQIVATDFVPIFPFESTFVSIGMGQRYDVIVEANAPPASYSIRAIPQPECSENQNPYDIKGIVHYSNVYPSYPTSNGHDFPNDCDDMKASDLVPYVPLNPGTKTYYGELPATVSHQNGTHIIRWYLYNSTMQVDWTTPTLRSFASEPGAQHAPLQTGNNSVPLSAANVWVEVVIEANLPVPHPIHLVRPLSSPYFFTSRLCTNELPSTATTSTSSTSPTAPTTKALSSSPPSILPGATLPCYHLQVSLCSAFGRTIQASG